LTSGPGDFHPARFLRLGLHLRSLVSNAMVNLSATFIITRRHTNES
jgi:hypothetical protein